MTVPRETDEQVLREALERELLKAQSQLTETRDQLEKANAERDAALQLVDDTLTALGAKKT